MKQLINIVFVIFLLSLTVSCSSNKTSNSPSEKIRLGYLLNMTHIVPIVGIEEEQFSDIEASYFLAGGYLINSLITGNLDMAYIGPGPFINAINKEIKVIALSASAKGANSLVFSHEYMEKHQNMNWEGRIKKLKNIGVPQYGNTQDLLAKELLANIKGLTFIAINPAEIETAFYTKAIDAALVTEPWGTLLESKGAQILKLEDLKKNTEFNQSFRKRLIKLNQYPASMLIAYKPYYRANKAKVDQFIAEQNSVLSRIKNDHNSALQTVRKHFKKLMNRELELDFLESSFNKVILSSHSKDIDIDLLNDMVKISREAKYIKVPLDRRFDRNTILIK